MWILERQGKETDEREYSSFKEAQSSSSMINMIKYLTGTILDAINIAVKTSMMSVARQNMM